jgi:tyrosine-protein kinase Etk/Wzc
MKIDNREFEELGSSPNLFTPDIEKSIITIAEIIHFFLQRKFKILISFILLTAVSSYLFFSTADFYQANVTFIPPPPDIVTTYRDNLISLSENPLDITRSLPLLDPIQIYDKLLNSRLIKQDIINQFGLMKTFGAEYNDDALTTLESITAIKINSGLIEISVKWNDPQLAADIANAYVDRLSSVLTQYSYSDMKKGRVFLEKRLAQVHQNLVLANKKLKEFKINKKMVDFDTQSRILVGTVADLKNRIFNLEMELTSLRTTYTDKSPRIKPLLAELKVLKEELNKKMLGRSLPLNSSNMEEEVVNFLDIPGVSIDYSELAREVGILEQIYLMLNKEYEYTKLKEAKELVSLKIIDKAVVPDKRANISDFRKIGLIALMSLVIVLGIVFIQYSLTKLNNFSPENYRIISRLKTEIKNEIIFWK